MNSTATQEDTVSDCDELDELATYSPREALEGWAAGERANGNAKQAEKYEAALEIQRAWRATDSYEMPDGSQSEPRGRVE